MVMGHILIYGIEALLWPFTYIMNYYVNNMYMIFGVYLGTFTAALEVALVITFFILSGVFYESSSYLANYIPWMEMGIYVLFVAGGWGVSYVLSPDAAVYLTHSRLDDGSIAGPQETKETLADLQNNLNWRGILGV